MGKKDEARKSPRLTENPVALSVMRTNAENHDEGADAVSTKTPKGATTKTPTGGADGRGSDASTPERTSVRGTASNSTSGSSSAGGGASGTGERPASVPPAGGAARPAAVPVGKAPSGATPAGLAAGAGPRRVRLGVTRIDPWSVLKFSFLMSFAIGIVIVVGAAMLWYLLNGLHVFTTINDTLAEIAGDETKINILDAVTFSRTVSLATIIALVDIVLLTVLSTIFAFLYNITSALVGGVTVTLSDE